MTDLRLILSDGDILIDREWNMYKVEITKSNECFYHLPHERNNKSHFNVFEDFNENLEDCADFGIEYDIMLVLDSSNNVKYDRRGVFNG